MTDQFRGSSDLLPRSATVPVRASIRAPGRIPAVAVLCTCKRIQAVSAERIYCMAWGGDATLRRMRSAGAALYGDDSTTPILEALLDG